MWVSVEYQCCIGRSLVTSWFIIRYYSKLFQRSLASFFICCHGGERLKAGEIFYVKHIFHYIMVWRRDAVGTATGSLSYNGSVYPLLTPENEVCTKITQHSPSLIAPPQLERALPSTELQVSVIELRTL